MFSKGTLAFKQNSLKTLPIHGMIPLACALK